VLHAGSPDAQTSHGLCALCEASFSSPAARPKIGRLAFPVMVLVLLALARPAAAATFDWKPALALTAGQSLDAISTVRFLSNGSGCTESNRVIGAHPATWTLVAQKAAVIGLGVGILQLTGKSDRKAMRVIGQVFSYALGVTGARSAARNVSLCGL
jgi:hypothetical protein